MEPDGIVLTESLYQYSTVQGLGKNKTRVKGRVEFEGAGYIRSTKEDTGKRGE